MPKQEKECEGRCVEGVSAVAVGDGQGHEDVDEDGGGMVGVAAQHITLDEMIQHLIREHTAIGNAEEEKHFFDWQIIEFDAREVLWIEAPNAVRSKDAVPNNEECCRNEQGREECLPLFVELQFPLERKSERNSYRTEVYEEIGVVQKLLASRF